MNIQEKNRNDAILEVEMKQKVIRGLTEAFNK